MVRRTTPVSGHPEEELFRKARDIADALREVPGIPATEYKAGGKHIRVIFAVPDPQAGNLIRRLLGRLGTTPALPDDGYRLGIYDTDDRNILLFLDTREEYAGLVLAAVKSIGSC